MNIQELNAQMDAVVTQGAIVDAVQQFFAEEAVTSDYNQNKTVNKQQMIAKMESFAGAISAVNGITYHGAVVDGNISMSEFTFDFEMKDNSKIYWHEIIKRQWNDQGKVIAEIYFNAA